MERGDESNGVDRRRRRLVPQGLPAARARDARWPGSCASSRSTTARASGSTASRSGTNTRRLPPVRVRACRRRSSAAARTGSSSASTRAARATDFPPVGPARATGVPTGGWWNYGGHPARGLPAPDRRGRLRRGPGAPDAAAARPARATVDYRAQVRNARPTARARHASPAASASQRVNLGTRDGRAAARSATFTGRVRVPQPAAVVAGDARTSTTCRSRVRVGRQDGAALRAAHAASARSRSSDGRLLLNGQPLNFRGVGLHEDSAGPGLRDRQRAAATSSSLDAKELGATLLRTHYPLHPYTHELADRLGILLWSEIPVYPVKTEYLGARDRPAAGGQGARDEHRRQRQPPVGDPLVDRQRAQLAARARRRAPTSARRSALAKALDPTRPVGLRRRRLPDAPAARREYGPLDVLGINDYFGWYPGPSGQIADRDAAVRYLDTVRACYPNKAIMVTEFGAEANRDGPVEEKGTLRLPAGLRQLPPRRLRDEAVAVAARSTGRCRSSACARLGRRQPAADPADPPEGPHQLRRRRRSRRSSTCSGSSRPPSRSADRRRAAGPVATIARRPWLPRPPSSAIAPREPGELARDAPPAPRGPGPRRPLRRADEPLAFAVDARDLRHALAATGAVARARDRRRPRTPAVLKDRQRHPVRGETMHVDLLRVDLDVAIQATVAARARRRRGEPRASARAASSSRSRARSTSRRCRTTSPSRPARRLRAGDQRDRAPVGRPGARGRHAPRRPDETVIATLIAPRRRRGRGEEEGIEKETERVGEDGRRGRGRRDAGRRGRRAVRVAARRRPACARRRSTG